MPLADYAGWSWIFIIEGLITFVVGILSFWMVHDWPDQAKFLTPLERECVIQRLQREQGLASEGKLNGTIVKRALGDWRTYCLMLMYIGAAEPLYSYVQCYLCLMITTDTCSVSLFSPTIISYLGKFTTPQSLLLSTPRKHLIDRPGLD